MMSDLHNELFAMQFCGLRITPNAAVAGIEHATLPERQKRCPDCSDLDEDCPDVLDKVNCWLYAPERGMCPYLRA
jgi:hypothetical protein